MLVLRSIPACLPGLVVAAAAVLGHAPPAQAQANLTQFHYRWRNDDGGESGGRSYQASQTSNTVTTSTTDVLVPGMTLTPGAGDYHVWFSGSIEGDTGSTTQFVSLYVNGVQILHTERQIFTELSILNHSFPVALQARLTGVLDGQAIEVRWRTSGGVATLHERTLLVTQITPANSVEASETADATTTSAAYVLASGMTLTPGAGDYHVWFSSSVEGNTGATTQFVSLFLNGVQIPHTERQIFTEGSIANTSFPVALHARLTGVPAGQAIDVRWRTTGGTATLHERSLLVSRIDPGNSSQVSATADTTTTSTTDALLSGMTLSPGDGDYHVWFSGSMEGNTGETGRMASLYLNGVQVPHTERQVDTDTSIPNTSFPVALHARLTGVASGQAIEVRWRTTGGTSTMHERTLVVEKASAAATFAAAEDTKLTGLGKNVPKRVRFEVSNEGSLGSGAVTYQLQVAETATCGSGAYTAVPTDTSGDWQVLNSSFLNDGEATSNISPGLTDEAATFVGGQLKDAGNATGGLSLNVNEFTEIEFAIQATSNAADGGDYCFRLFNLSAGLPLNTYTAYAEVRLAGGTLSLADHSAGQVGDRFTSSASVTDVLFRFKLTRSGTLTVNTLRVNFTTGGGVANGDVTNGELWVDNNSDGLIDGGDTLIQSGVTPAAGVLTFTNNFSPGAAGTDYLVRATVSNLLALDTTTFSVGSADMDEVEVDVAERGLIGSAAHTEDCNCPVNFRSIGTNTGNLASAGTASVAQSTTTVTFSVSLPTNIGLGDQLILAPDNEELFIRSRDSATQVTVQTPALNDHFAVTYTIKRKYNTLAAWETARQGNLVLLNRREVGVVYNDPAAFTAGVTIDGSTTDACRFMWLTVAPGHRHNGTAGTGATVDGGDLATGEILIQDDYTIVEWLELKRARGASGTGSVRVEAGNALLTHLLVHDTKVGIRLSGTGGHSFTARNCVVYATDDEGFEGDDWTDTATIENCTVYQTGVVAISSYGIDEIDSTFTVRNTISMNGGGGDFDLVDGVQSNNVSSDPTAFCNTCLPGRTATTNPTPGPGNWVVFTNLTAGSENFHLQTSAENDAVNSGEDLSASFWDDIDGQSRLGLTWDRGADELGAPTAVALSAFRATAGDGEVLLEWETASELNNLGFHLYRSTTKAGAYECLTSRAIPGLGSSPAGARYSYRDSGLENGVTYYYKLEDIDTTGKTKLHGPVSGTPQAGASLAALPREAGEEGIGGGALITYGDPSANSFRVLKRDPRKVVLELITEGFYGRPLEDGSVLLEIPGFAPLSAPGSPSIPVKRSWVEARAGRRAEISWVRAQAEDFVAGFPLAGGEAAEVVASDRGTVRARRRARPVSLRAAALYPEEAARLLSVGFQGEVKKALVELAPLRWEGSTGRLRLTRRLLVGLTFRLPEPEELTGDGARGPRRPRRGPRDRRVAARLATTERGLYALPYEDVFPARGRGIPSTSLRLSRQGEPVAFHIEGSAVAPDSFAPGSRLYFLSEGDSANPYGRESVYELELNSGGTSMAAVSAPPQGPETHYYLEHLQLEQNRYYQAALLDAPDHWLWDVLFAPVVKRYPFQVSSLLLGNLPSRFTLWLQGASDFEADPDHHVRMYVNGTLQAELAWDGKQARRVDVELLPGVLHEGENLLEIENLRDTGAAYSMVMLDRFAVDYPRRLLAQGGRLQGRWEMSGTATVWGVDAPAFMLDVTEKQPKWLTGGEIGSGTAVRFRVEAGRSYLTVAEAEVLRPAVRRPAPGDLKSPAEGADYLVIGPREFLNEAEPLLSLRRSQALRVKGAAIEDVYDEFGFGETTPQAIRGFLDYAYHRWPRPAPRYVLLLGDGTYDFKGYLKTGAVNRVPPLVVKTTYLWTASDPTLAAVNAEDPLPDLAIGRLPASNVEELRVMVEKVVAYETGEARLSSALVLVTDNPDKAGDFVADAESIASGVLAGREVRRLHLSELGTAALRGRIREAFDQGAFLLSYMGHGGIHLWADENIFNIGDVSFLTPQDQQPLFLTLTCLNGYFHFPYFNSLSEELLKAEGKGAIAAFSPTGLSLNTAAHQFHQLLLDELFNKGRARLGDAVMAAQASYAESGAFPELLQIYHLFGDPALRIR